MTFARKSFIVLSLSLRLFFISIVLTSLVDFASISSRSRSNDDDIASTSHSLFRLLIILLILTDRIGVVLKFKARSDHWFSLYLLCSYFWIVYLVYINHHYDIKTMSHYDCFDFFKMSCCRSIVVVYSFIYQKAQFVFIVYQREIDVARVIRMRVSRISLWLLNHQNIIIHYIYFCNNEIITFYRDLLTLYCSIRNSILSLIIVFSFLLLSCLSFVKFFAHRWFRSFFDHSI